MPHFIVLILLFSSYCPHPIVLLILLSSFYCSHSIVLILLFSFYYSHPIVLNMRSFFTAEAPRLAAMLEVSCLRHPEQPVALGRSFCGRVLRPHALHVRVELPGIGRPFGLLHIFDLLTPGEAWPENAAASLAERAPKGRLLTVQAMARGPAGAWRLCAPLGGVRWPEGAQEGEGFVCGRMRERSGLLVSLPARADQPRPEVGKLLATCPEQALELRAFKVGQKVKVELTGASAKGKLRLKLPHWEGEREKERFIHISFIKQTPSWPSEVLTALKLS